CAARGAEARDELRPTESCLRVPRQAMQPAYTLLEPAFKPCPPPALGQQPNPEPYFAENDRIDRQVSFILPQPLHYGLLRCRAGGFAEHVCIDEKLHRSSVDSDEIGTKKSFSGHARSQSTRPSLIARRRTR